MLQQPPNLLFSGGIDRTVSSRLSPTSSFYDLYGMRQSQINQGLLETAPFFNDTNFSVGTGEDSTTPLVGVMTFRDALSSRSVYITPIRARTIGGTTVQIFNQFSFPAADTINTQCRLKINNVGGLNITLFSYVYVVIDTPTSFQWSKNGGGLSASTPIVVGGVDIDSGNATIFFLTDTDFNVADEWEWRRSDSFVSPFPLVYTRPPSSVQYGNELFFTAPTSQVFSYYNATNADCIVSAGYRPFYASYLTVFDDHLICAGFSSEIGSLYISYPETLTWANSDKTDVHNMFPTRTNEADRGILPVSQDAATKGTVTLGTFVVNQNLFIATSQGLFYTPALGLPVVFSFQQFCIFPMNLVANSLAASFFPCVQGRDCVYIVTERGPWKFDGGNFIFVGNRIQSFFLTNGVPNTALNMLTCYNSAQQELSWIVGTILYTYQERTDSFYRRSIDFTTGAYCLGVESNCTVSGGRNITLHKEDIAFSGTPQKNLTSGNAFATPKAILQALTAPHIGLVKELSSVYLSAETLTGGSNYSTGSALQVQLSWYLSATGQPVSETTSATAVWTSASLDGQIGEPRLSYHAVNLALSLNGLAADKPPGQINIAGLLADVPEIKPDTR